MLKLKNISAKEAAQFLDTIDITIFGHPVIDHVARMDDPMTMGEAESVFKLGADYEMIFQEGSYIVTMTNGSLFKFGPLGMGGKVYNKGGKYTVNVVEYNRNDEQGVAFLGYPIVKLGGGGPNALQIMSQVFTDLKPEFIGTYSRKIDPTILRVLKKRTKNGRLDCIGIYENPPINIVFEGIGPKEERNIFKSPFPPIPLLERHPAHGKTVMVNTVYNNMLAINGLMDAGRDDKLGVLALTTSLCRKENFTEEEKSYFNEQYGAETFEGINNIYNFLTNLLLGNSEPILIMNEDELEHMSGVNIVEKVDEKSFIYFDRVLQGLKRMREYQRGHKPRIYFTMGSNGSLCLDENDVLHYHGVTDDVYGRKKGKNAIGDAYASAVLCAEHKSRRREKNLPASRVMDIAAALADAAVAEGVEYTDAAAVDRALTESYKNYIELGEIQEVDRSYGTIHTRVNDIRWDKYSIIGRRLDVWGNLEQLQ